MLSETFWAAYLEFDLEQEINPNPGNSGSHHPILTEDEEIGGILPFTRVCLSVGDDRARTRSFGQILSRRSCSIYKHREVVCVVEENNRKLP